MAELQELLTDDGTVVTDASYSSMWVLGQLRAPASGMRFITPRVLAGLGWEVPLAIGAKVAPTDKPVIAIVGDGGFAHSWAELETQALSRDFGSERVFARAMGLAEPAHIEAFFQALDDCWGKSEILVCNAGISPKGPDGPTPFQEITLDEWNAVLSVNT